MQDLAKRAVGLQKDELKLRLTRRTMGARKHEGGRFRADGPGEPRGTDFARGLYRVCDAYSRHVPCGGNPDSDRGWFDLRGSENVAFAFHMWIEVW